MRKQTQTTIPPISIGMHGMQPLEPRPKFTYGDKTARIGYSNSAIEIYSECFQCKVVGDCCMSSPDCIVTNKSKALNSRLDYQRKSKGLYAATYGDFVVEIKQTTRYMWGLTLRKGGAVIATSSGKTCKSMKEAAKKAIADSY